MNKSIDEQIREVLSKTPCIQCDGSGGTQVSEDEVEQCQFCWQLRYPYIDTAVEALKHIVEDAEIKVWERIKRAEGFGTNKDGCIEIHPDYIDEVLEQLKPKNHKDG